LFNIGKNSLLFDWGYFNSLSYVVHSIVQGYGKFPLHDPWVLGGIDILANPQSRIFSPFVLADIFLTAPVANAFSLVLLGFVGIAGCYKLLIYLGINSWIAVACSVIFINSSWFSLHFAVGHIPYGAFQLLGLCFYFILKLSKPKYLFYFSVLMAFFLLDGAIYTFVFSLLLVLISILFGVGDLNLVNIWKYLGREWKMLSISMLAFLFISAPKIIPLLFLHADRIPLTEVTFMQFELLLSSLFDPIQYVQKPHAFLFYGVNFHEFGCYLGLVGLLIVLWYLTKKNHFKQSIRFILIGGFFLFIALGRARDINPWRIIQLIPLVNNVHIQTRFLILFYLFYIILLAKSLDYFRVNKHEALWILLVLFLVLESLFVANYSFYYSYYLEKEFQPTIAFSKNIANTRIDQTKCSVVKPAIYFLKNTAAKNTYEPSAGISEIKCTDSSNYLGEIYLLSGKGSAHVIKFIPGEIYIFYELSQVAIIQLNTNFLAGWKVESGDAVAYSQSGLLTIETGNLKGELKLSYRPWYLPFVFGFFVAGLIIFFTIIFKLWKETRG